MNCDSHPIVRRNFETVLDLSLGLAGEMPRRAATMAEGAKLVTSMRSRHRAVPL
jgi:hypothetical protein